MTQDVAVVAAGLAGFLLTSWLSPAALDAWGWRIAFLIGLAVVPIGLYMRHNLPETIQDFDRRITTAEQRRVPVQLIVLSLVLIMATTIYFLGSTTSRRTPRIACACRLRWPSAQLW